MANINQIGQSINGSTSSDKVGDSVSLNGAGDIVAIAIPGSRCVRTYRYIGNNWVQIGQDINVSNLSNLAIIVKLNKIGDTLAVACYDANQVPLGDYSPYPSNDNIIVYTWSDHHGMCLVNLSTGQLIKMLRVLWSMGLTLITPFHSI